ncbi:hypothetical protein AB3X52_03970 [Nocardioides sp. DS6]|uniref:TPM domain-containing protein n=1 Tax=Nocardioides eburneus TaxID=3231482 RepID=A0ABV3SWL2_9ACTN
MRRILAVPPSVPRLAFLTLLAPLALLLALGSATTSYAAPTDSSELDATVAAWQEGPVYLSPASGAVTPAQADALASRIEGWRDDVHVAVLPALALGAGHTPQQAMAFTDRLADAWHARTGGAGVFLVSFSGVGTYAGSYDPIRSGDEQVGAIMADEVGRHTLGQQYQILDAVLTRLGAPGSQQDAGGDGLPAWLVVLLVLVVVAALAAAAAWVVAFVRRRPRRRASGEVWAGPASYAPSYQTFRDETDTPQERTALAREDVTRLGEELDAADLPTSDPRVAEHVRAALDAYADAGRRVDALPEAAPEEELRRIDQVAEYARWQLATARATLAGDPPPSRRVPCFLDPAHGTSVADVSWAPPGGVVRAIPVCQSCYDRITGQPTREASR